MLPVTRIGAGDSVSERHLSITDGYKTTGLHRGSSKPVLPVYSPSFP